MHPPSPALGGHWQTRSWRCGTAESVCAKLCLGRRRRSRRRGGRGRREFGLDKIEDGKGRLGGRRFAFLFRGLVFCGLPIGFCGLLSFGRVRFILALPKFALYFLGEDVLGVLEELSELVWVHVLCSVGLPDVKRVFQLINVLLVAVLELLIRWSE